LRFFDPLRFLALFALLWVSIDCLCASVVAWKEQQNNIEPSLEGDFGPRTGRGLLVASRLTFGNNKGEEVVDGARTD